MKLWTPGPTNIDQEISDLILKGIVHHRSNLAEFYITKLHDNLKKMFNTTKATPIAITASGTGVMESAVVNLIESTDKVILISVGDFGDRFYEILKLYIKDHNNIFFFRYPDYSTYNIDDFKHLIPEVKAVFVTHHETSTGVLNNISELGKLTKNTDALLVCDSVSSVLNEEFNFDDWSVDIAFASSAKGFSIYPGLSIVCISQKAEKVIQKCTTPRYYFDYRKYLKYYRDYKQTPFTPAINLIVSMSESIDIMNNTSLQVINQKKWEVFNYLNDELEKLNFVNKVPVELRTCSMLCMEAPKGIDCEKMRNYVSSNSNNYFELGRNEKRHSVIRVGISRLITIDDAKIVVKNIKKFIESEKNEK
ncbi:aminotransferase class V-fold PLP-dependent enzyme [Mycoplasma anatis]|nr:aminotransferase class V-fold PLP-dependent enzyme [Mycoplasmopsis anatis]